MTLRVVFAGTGSFAVPFLRALCEEDCYLACVVTRPDRPKGRSRRPVPSPAGEEAERLGLSVRKPERIKELASELGALACDLLLVVDYGEILPRSILSIPRIGPFNAHASLLPRWRGAAPTAYAVKAGDSVSGVTIFRMVEELDAGPILLQREVAVEKNDTGGTLKERCAREGVVLLKEALARFRSGSFTLTEQDPEAVTYAPKLKKGDGLILWAESAVAVERHIRAMQPWPGAYSFLLSRLSVPLRITVLEGEVAACGPSGPPGRVVSVDREGFSVACGEGVLRVLRLKPAGGRQMPAGAFLRGRRLCEGDTFSSLGGPN